MRHVLTSAGIGLFALSLAGSAHAHCQVPCGIYDDSARIHAMEEDTTTISKAVTNIVALSGKMDPQSMNQLIRWTNTKEEHASMIIDVISTYFLTQKLKPVAAGADGYDAYVQSLVDHHAVMRAAMKTKQTADPAAVADLEKAIAKVATRW